MNTRRLREDPAPAAWKNPALRMYGDYPQGNWTLDFVRTSPSSTPLFPKSFTDEQVAMTFEWCAALCEQLGRARDEVSAQDCADAIRDLAKKDTP